MDALSLRPSDAQQGGFLDDVDVTIKEARFAEWDYMGKADKPSIALKVTLLDGDGGEHDQYYSAGDPAKIKPSPDGKTVVSKGTATGLNANTNAMAFITSVINAGFPEDKLSNDCSIFDGMLVHVNQIAQPKRAGLKDQKDRTYILVTKILKLPWEPGQKTPAKGAPVAKPAPAAAVAVAPVASPAAPVGEPPTPALAEKARSVILQLLLEKGGSVAKGKLPTEAFRTLASDPDRNTIVTLVFNEQFLQQQAAEGAFAYDGATVTLA